jgi:hypothetical protein
VELSSGTSHPAVVEHGKQCTQRFDIQLNSSHLAPL